MTKPPLYAITLHRPWAFAVAHLNKDIENRTWECPLEPGSYIAIHAGKTWDEEGAEWIGLERLPPEPEHPLGIVAIARFMGNITTSNSPWFFGPVGWKLEGAIAIPPVACRGRQKLWRVPEELLPELRAAYRSPRTNAP